MAETVTKKENIKNLCSELNNKSQFIINAANEFGKTPGTLQNHWFSGFYSVPEEYEDRVITMLQNAIANQ